MSDVIKGVLANFLFWLIATALAGVAFAFWRRRHAKFYLPLVLTDTPDFITQIENGAHFFFSHQMRPPVPRLGSPPQNESAVIGTLDAKAWRRLLQAAIKGIREAEELTVWKSFLKIRVPVELQLVSGTLTLWNLALGTLLNNHHGIVLYHFQEVGGGPKYQRIWKIDRTVKNLRAPIADKAFAYRLLRCCEAEGPRPSQSSTSAEQVVEVGAESTGVSGGSTEQAGMQSLDSDRRAPLAKRSTVRECLVFKIGANQISPLVRAYRKQYLPDSGLRIFEKTAELSPRVPQEQDHYFIKCARTIGSWLRLAAPYPENQWVRLAAEVAHAVCDQGRDELVAERYLFADMPAVLALMAGDSIGSYHGIRLHLMQFDTRNNTYCEVLCLPDKRLSKLPG